MKIIWIFPKFMYAVCSFFKDMAIFMMDDIWWLVGIALFIVVFIGVPIYGTMHSEIDTLHYMAYSRVVDPDTKLLINNAMKKGWISQWDAGYIDEKINKTYKNNRSLLLKTN